VRELSEHFQLVLRAYLKSENARQVALVENLVAASASNRAVVDEIMMHDQVRVRATGRRMHT
jgi:hypothetical protein